MKSKISEQVMSKDEVSSYWNQHTASVNMRFVCSPLLVSAQDFLYKGPARGPIQMMGMDGEVNKDEVTIIKSTLLQLCCNTLFFLKKRLKIWDCTHVLPQSTSHVS